MLAGAFLGTVRGTDLRSNVSTEEAPLPVPLVKAGDCPLYEMRQEDSIIVYARRNLNRLTEVYKAYRLQHPGAVGVLELRFIIDPDGSVAVADVDSGTFFDTAFTAAVKTAVRAWQFCPVDDALGSQQVSFRLSFADKNGMVRPMLQPTDDILVKRNLRVFKKWCSDTVRKAYRHYLAFKGPAHGSLEFKFTCERGRLTAINLAGGSLTEHPIKKVIVPLGLELVGKRIRGGTETDIASFTLLLLDLRAAVTVFDGRMEYKKNRGWYYSNPFNTINIPQWQPPSVPPGF